MADHKMNSRMGMQNGGRMNRSGGYTMRGMNRADQYNASAENGCGTSCGEPYEKGGCGCSGCGEAHGNGGCGCSGYSGMRSEGERHTEHHADCSLCKEAMERLKMLEFAIVDVAHYLNAYPDSDCALAYYHKLREERDLLRAKMNEECGPLTIYDNVSRDSWDWVKGPWPWKPEAN